MVLLAVKTHGIILPVRSMGLEREEIINLKAQIELGSQEVTMLADRADLAEQQRDALQ